MVISKTKSSRTSSASPTPGGLRISQRQPLSCTECTRRKTRCNKNTPCQNCIKRRVPDRCHVQQIIPSKSMRNPVTLQSLREETQIDNAKIERGLAQLEDLVAGRRHGAIRSSEDEASTSLGGSPSVIPSYPVEDGMESEIGQEAEGSSDEEAVAAATLEFLAMGRVRAKSPGGKDDSLLVGLGDSLAAETHQWEPIPWERTISGDSGIDNENIRNDLGLGIDVDAGAEFPWDVGEDTMAPWMTTFGSSMPVAAAVTSVPPRSRPHGGHSAHKIATRAEILSKLPSIAVGKALVKYDVDNVQWMTYCYHGPTLIAETDLFWSELGSQDVEINWAFLSLLFGVLLSALCHMPSSIAESLLPGRNRYNLLETWFESCLMSLHEANWMSSHSLYSVQCIAIIVSPANHLGKADLYFTLLGAAVKVAQALNLHGLGPDPEEQQGQRNGASCIAREVRKRAWWQLVIQDWFHLGFNGTCSIQSSQFNTPSPTHCADSPIGIVEIPLHLPAIASHTYHLSKLATLINRGFCESPGSREAAFDLVVDLDNEMKKIFDQTPVWMKDKTLQSVPSAPNWLDWQKDVFKVSAAHKIIVLHRPCLGRAFRGDQLYAKSRETCMRQARSIIGIFQQCRREEFRRTWTVLAHTLAACLILLLDASFKSTESEEYLTMMAPVHRVVAIFKELANGSYIASRGATVLSVLIQGSTSGDSAGSGSGAQLNGFNRELARAVSVFRRGRTIPTVASSGFDKVSSMSIAASELHETTRHLQGTSWMADFPMATGSDTLVDAVDPFWSPLFTSDMLDFA